jgi:hypothetical protein
MWALVPGTVGEPDALHSIWAEDALTVAMSGGKPVATLRPPGDGPRRSDNRPRGGPGGRPVERAKGYARQKGQKPVRYSEVLPGGAVGGPSMVL